MDVNGDGTLDESGPGWNGYESQELANLVTRAHAAGDRVVLTVTYFSQTSLDQITSYPTAAARLSASLISPVAAKNLDGVNFDFEGEGNADQNGLRAHHPGVGALQAANPHWQVTMATYASAAGDPAGFYNIAALAPAVDGFFVMAYDMNDRTPAQPRRWWAAGSTIPRPSSSSPRWCRLQGDPGRAVLRLRLADHRRPRARHGRRVAPQLRQSSRGRTPHLLGPVTETAWTSYQVGSQWHEPSSTTRRPWP